MKKLIRAVLAAVFYLSSVTAFAGEPPQGFRQIPWGVNVAELKNMEVADPGGSMSMYTKKADVLKVGEADIASLFYGFYNDRFYSVYIYFKTPENFAKIKSALVLEHGDPATSAYDVDGTSSKYAWQTGDQVAIALDYNERRGTGNLTYLFKPISEQQERDNSL